MAWTKVAGQDETNNATSGLTLAATAMSTNPTVGNVVCVAAFWYGGGASGSTATCQDNNGKAYTKAPHGPSTYESNTGQMHLFYRICTGGEGATVTVTFGSTIVLASIHLSEFAPPSGTSAFDDDAMTQSSGTPITSPTVPVAGADDLLFTGCAVSDGITATNSPWTDHASGNFQYGERVAYDLHAASGTAVNFTAGGGTFGCVGMSFTLAGAGVTVGLTGVVGTGAVGTATAGSGFTPTGKIGTGSVGTTSPGISIPLVGRVGTAAIGSVAFGGVAVALTGQAATGAAGLITATGNVSVALTGVAGTGAVGTVLPYRGTVIGFTRLGRLTPFSGQVGVLSGVQGAGAVGLVAAVGGNQTAILSGLGMAGQVGTVTPAHGLIGQAATTAIGTIPPVNIAVPLVGVSAAAARGTLGAIAGPGPVLTGVSASDPGGTQAVLFSWNADPNPAVTGYHVELGTAPGLNNSYDLDAGAALSLLAIINKGTYFYRIRSYIGVTPDVASPDGILVVSGRLGILTPSTAVRLTGVQGLAVPGSLAAASDVVKGLAGVAGVSAVGIVTAQSVTFVTVALTGVGAVAAVGAVGSARTLPLTSVASVDGTGTLGVVIAAPLVAVPAQAQQGNVGASVGLNATVTVSGVQAAAAVGTILPNNDGAATLTGIGVLGAVGSVGVIAGAGATVQSTGVQATSAVGTVLAGADATVALVGVAGTGAAGFLGVIAGTGATIQISGTQAVGAVGTMIPSTPPITLALTGKQATAAVGFVGVNLSGSATVPITGVEGDSAVGAVAASTPPVTVAATGVQAAGAAGNLGVSTGSAVTVALTGVQGITGSGTVGPEVALTLVGRQIAILEGSLVGGLALTGFELDMVMNSVGVDLAVGLGGVQASGGSGTIGTSVHQIPTIVFQADAWAAAIVFSADDWIETSGVT